MITWIRRLLGIHTSEEIVAEIEAEPTIKAARRALGRADRILRELESIERRRGVRRARDK